MKRRIGMNSVVSLSRIVMDRRKHAMYMLPYPQEVINEWKTRT
jgi:hypothetical protein